MSITRVEEQEPPSLAAAGEARPFCFLVSLGCENGRELLGAPSSSPKIARLLGRRGSGVSLPVPVFSGSTRFEGCAWGTGGASD